MQKIVAISGGFDPLHAGHIKLINGAARYGAVIIFLNSDDFLIKKKGYCSMPYEHRKFILENIKNVERVIMVIDNDQTVCRTLEKIKPDFFINGGDRTKKNIPETEICKQLGITMVFGIGGKKIYSSSNLILK